MAAARCCDHSCCWPCLTRAAPAASSSGQGSCQQAAHWCRLAAAALVPPAACASALAQACRLRPASSERAAPAAKAPLRQKTGAAAAVPAARQPPPAWSQRVMWRGRLLLLPLSTDDVWLVRTLHTRQALGPALRGCWSCARYCCQRKSLCCCCGCRVQLFLGCRHLWFRLGRQAGRQ